MKIASIHLSQVSGAVVTLANIVQKKENYRKKTKTSPHKGKKRVTYLVYSFRVGIQHTRYSTYHVVGKESWRERSACVERLY